MLSCHWYTAAVSESEIRTHNLMITSPAVLHTATGGTTVAAPPPFRPGNPALCGSCPLVTPYYCRLGDLLCYTCLLYLSTFLCVCMCILCFLCSLCCFPLQLSPSVLWYCWLDLLTCKNRLPYNLYCVGGDVKHCTIQSNPHGHLCSAAWPLVAADCPILQLHFTNYCVCWQASSVI